MSDCNRMSPARCLLSRAWISILISLFWPVSVAAGEDFVQVLTDTWPPYTNGECEGPGSAARVLDWSPKILQASNTDRRYKTMIDASRVVVLNGPHVGKELMVRNMPIELP